MRGHEEYKEMIAAHALGALERAEARELDEHLATCAECRAEWDAWQETAARLAYAAPLAEPPPELRSRILAAVRAESAQQVSRAGVKTDGHVVKSGAAGASKAETKVLPFAKPERRAWSAGWKVGALAASLAFVALAVSLFLLWNRYSAMQQDMARLTNEAERSRVELQREREAREIISSPESRITALAGTEMATRAHAKLVYDRRTGRAMLMAYDLPPAPAGKAYQLWYIAEGKPPMPGHVFNTNAAGHAEMRDQLPEEARHATIFAVTLEPSNGVPAPTGPKYLLGATS